MGAPVSAFFRVAFDTSDAIKGLENLKRTHPFAVTRALNRSADSGKTAMTRAIAADTGLAARAVRDQLIVARANAGNQVATITVRGKRIPLIDFKARGLEPTRGKGRGVSYRLPTGRGRAERAFIATMSTGHRGVFMRTGRSRLPIRELFGPSLPHVFAKYQKVGRDRAYEQLFKNLRSELRFEMAR